MSFAGFELSRVNLGEISTSVRHGGSGPPVLLHGWLAAAKRDTSG